MKYLLAGAFVLSFLITLVTLPKWIKTCKRTGLLWEDMNKYNHPKNVASSGGIIVVMAFTVGALYYIALTVFSFDGMSYLPQIFALLSMILILGVIGLVDDLLGWKNGGLSSRIRVALAFFASIPLVVINAGTQTMNVPIFGIVDFGLFYPLLIIPLGVAGATTTYNFLAGFNG
jgi:UDP-N-acetylglucosamine--dolichyl-phosphate N-acetylglucosaminephosphotransferase